MAGRANQVAPHAETTAVAAREGALVSAGKSCSSECYRRVCRLLHRLCPRARREVDRSSGPAPFIARRVSAHRRKVEGYDGGVAGFAVARRRNRDFFGTETPRREDELGRSDGRPPLRRL